MTTPPTSDVNVGGGDDGSCVPQHVGIAVYCIVCRRRKKPVGRSAPDAYASALCDRECSGYDIAPHVGSLWPNETCADFGFAHSHHATKELS